MRLLVSLLVLLAASGASGATFQSVGTTNDLVRLPAPSLSVSSNFVVSSTADLTSLEAWQWQTGDSHTPDGVTYLASVFQPGAGNFVKMSFGGGGGIINPTDGYVGYRVNSTTEGDSPWYRISGTSMGFGGTDPFLTYTQATELMGLGRNALLSATFLNGSGSTTDIDAIGDSAGRNGIFSGTFDTQIWGDAAAQNARFTNTSSTIIVGPSAGFGTKIGNVPGITATGASAASSATFYNSNGGMEFYGVGSGLGLYATNANYITAIGTDTIRNFTVLDGSYQDVFYGYRSGYNSKFTNSIDLVALGPHTFESFTGTRTNAIAIGSYVTPAASNTAQIGTNGMSALLLNGTAGWYRGTGSPNGVVTANPGSFYLNESGGAGTTFYVKESGTGSSGWQQK